MVVSELSGQRATCWNNNFSDFVTMVSLLPMNTFTPSFSLWATAMKCSMSSSWVKATVTSWWPLTAANLKCLSCSPTPARSCTDTQVSRQQGAAHVWGGPPVNPQRFHLSEVKGEKNIHSNSFIKTFFLNGLTVLDFLFFFSAKFNFFFNLELINVRKKQICFSYSTSSSNN